MSDDEYIYQDAEYEDFQEMLYDADPAPELADDLAEHASYSPVWQDNPTEELRHYFSDWDYYSDDYFDDDPNLLTGNVESGERFKDGVRPVQPKSKRGRKRKFSEAREKPQPPRREIEALTASLRGTVWKTQSPEPAAAYQKGRDRPVSLKLSDEIMRSAYSKTRGFGKGKLNRDESWANELSLADMGLKAERSTSIHERPTREDADAGDDLGKEEDEEGYIDEEAVDTESVMEEPYRVELQAEPALLDTMEARAEVEIGRPLRKRRKKDADEVSVNTGESLPPPQPPQPGPGSPASEKTPLHPASNAREDTKKDSTVPATASVEAAPGGGKKANGTNRKRKLSASESSAPGSTASIRAKRIDTKAPAVESRGIERTAATSRPSRTRKK